MQNVLKNVIKNGLILFTVGVALAFAAPALAQALGESFLGTEVFERAMETPKFWTGAFFGMFGALSAAVTPLYDAVFGGGKDKPREAAQEKCPQVAPQKCQQVALVIPQTGISQENNLAKFQDALKAERAISSAQKSLAP